MKIFIVDAFTDKPYSGNPAAVAIVDEFPSDEQCQRIASEINLSETAFIKPLVDNKFHLRWFTPMVEVKLCGHGTLASAHILYQEGIVVDKPIEFNTLSGVLTVSKNGEYITLDFPLQEAGPSIDKENIEEIFEMSVIAVDKALDCIIVELAESEVRDLKITPDKIMSIDCRGVIVTARSTGKYDFISRYFAPRVGINEDPVTGSAHCKLAHYWQKKLNKNKFHAYQASKRGGELILEIRGSRLLISGHAVTILRGLWLSNQYTGASLASGTCLDVL
jgi:PhzF family phenazine biosynthesis protein